MATGTEVKTIRAWRPSCFSNEKKGESEEAEKTERAVNIPLYARRAAAGLPLFTEESNNRRRRNDLEGS